MDHQGCGCVEKKKVQEIGGGRIGFELDDGHLRLCLLLSVYTELIINRS